MDTIFIENLTYTGVHGVYKREHHISQRFTISLRMEVDTTTSGKSDSLDDTVDYKKIQEEIKHIIEGEHHDLLESLAEEIASMVLVHKKVTACEVTIKKPDAFEIGTPGVTIKRSSSAISSVSNEEATNLLSHIEKDGVGVLYLLNEETLKKIKEELISHTFVEAEKFSGPYRVEQNFKFSRTFPKNSILWQITKDIESLFKKTNLFSTPLSFNEITAQVTEVTETGISLHRDESRFCNLIVVCIIDGVGEFSVAEDREGTKEKVISTKPGDILFMRAPGFMNENIRPFHAVKNVTKKRTSVTFRQEIL